ERAEGVYHDGQLFGLFLADGGFGGSGVGAVGYAVGVEGEGGDVYAFATHEVAVDVVEDLFAVYVGVVVGGGYGQRVVVVLAGHEGADDEVLGLEGLVRGRGLVDAAGDRLEVFDVE